MRKVHRVTVASHDDERLADRMYVNGHRRICPAALPPRAHYLIEDNSPMRAIKKALKLAEGDGISRPIWTTIEWVNHA